MSSSAPADHICGHCKHHHEPPKRPRCTNPDSRTREGLHFCNGCPPGRNDDLPVNPPRKETPKKSEGGKKKQASGGGSKQKQALEQSQDTKHDGEAESAADEFSGAGESANTGVDSEDGPNKQVVVAVEEDKERRDSKWQVTPQSAAIGKDEAEVKGELSRAEDVTEE